MTSWLLRQRKQILLDLGKEAGLDLDEETRKDELIDSLDQYLRANKTRLAGNATFEPYYGTRSRTPYKTNGAVADVTSDDGEVKSVVKGRGRRATKVKEEFAETDHGEGAPSPTRALITKPTVTDLTAKVAAVADKVIPRRTPGRPRRSELPPSPADVADLAEQETLRIKAGLDDLYSVSGIPDAIANVRNLCSSVTGVQMTFLLIEAFSLQRAVLPWKWVADLPSIPALGVPSIPISIPDLFVILTPEFWLPTLLWSATSLFVPMLFAYFYNLTIHQVRRHGASAAVPRYTIDPLMFNVAKALVTYIVYRGNAVDEGAVYDQHPVTETIKNAMPLGSQGILIGSYVTILATLYEATLART